MKKPIQQRIKELIAETMAHAVSSLEQARHLGSLLCEARAQIPDDTQWASYVQSACRLTVDHAEAFLDFYHRWPDIKITIDAAVARNDAETLLALYPDVETYKETRERYRLQYETRKGEPQ